MPVFTVRPGCPPDAPGKRYSGNRGHAAPWRRSFGARPAPMGTRLRRPKRMAGRVKQRSCSRAGRQRRIGGGRLPGNRAYPSIRACEIIGASFLTTGDDDGTSPDVFGCRVAREGPGLPAGGELRKRRRRPRDRRGFRRTGPRRRRQGICGFPAWLRPHAHRPPASGSDRGGARSARSRHHLLREQRSGHPARRSDLRSDAVRGEGALTSSGSEATLYAMRAVRALRGRSKILKFEGGYHGMNDYALMSLAPSRRSNGTDPIPDSPGIPGAVNDEVLVVPYNDLDAVTSIVEEHHDSIAGVIVEAFQRVIRPRPGFLEGLRAPDRAPRPSPRVRRGRHRFPLRLRRRPGVLRGGADLCTVGKVVGGGFPLAGLAGREEIMAQFDRDSAGGGGFLPQIGTLSGNPIAATAGSRDARGPAPGRRLHAAVRQRPQAHGRARGARCATPASRRRSPASRACSISCSPGSRLSITGRWRAVTRTSSHCSTRYCASMACSRAPPVLRLRRAYRRRRRSRHRGVQGGGGGDREALRQVRRRGRRPRLVRRLQSGTAPVWPGQRNEWARARGERCRSRNPVVLDRDDRGPSRRTGRCVTEWSGTRAGE